MAEHKLYREVVEALLSDPRVTEANMFGMPALKVGGKAFAGLWEKQLLVKVGAPRAQELLKTKTGRSADPSGRGRPMKEWIAIKEPAAQAKQKWLALAEEAKAFVEHAS
jgi:TfoX/Sxy family transcriptional regulator of competence genes